MNPSRQNAAAALVAAVLVPLLVVLLAVTGGSPAHGGQPAVEFAPAEENPEAFPAGPGRDETFYACTSCHAFQLVAKQGLGRAQWDDTLTWMTERHNMPKLEGEQRELVLDYLATHFAPKTAPGWRNPFAQ